MADNPDPLFAGFKGRLVQIDCGSDRLAWHVRLRLNHLLAAPDTGASATLRLTLTEPAESYVELRDSAGRYVAGSLEHVLYFVRKWTTADFVAAYPNLLWLHAGAAAKDGGGCCWRVPPEPARARSWYGCWSEAGVCSATMSCRLMSIDRLRCLSRSHRMFGRPQGQTSTTSEHSSNSRSRWCRYPPIAWHGNRPHQRDCLSGVRSPSRRPVALADFCRIGRRDAGQGVLVSNLGHTRARCRRVRLAQRTASYRLDYGDATAAAADLEKLQKLRVGTGAGDGDRTRKMTIG